MSMKKRVLCNHLTQEKTYLRIEATLRKQNRFMKGEKKQALIICLNPEARLVSVLSLEYPDSSRFHFVVVVVRAYSG